MFQDEYLEWSVNRNDDDEIINAEFTCEGPEVRLNMQTTLSFYAIGF